VERVGGRSESSNRASSICRRAICPLSSSSRPFQSGMDVQRVFNASKFDKFEVAIVNAVRSKRRCMKCGTGTINARTQCRTLNASKENRRSDEVKKNSSPSK
jgi:ribosomal protein S27AE